MGSQGKRRTRSELPSPGKIHIVGPSRLQNELIAGCLNRETGAECLVWPDVSSFVSGDHTQEPKGSSLLLVDCQGREPREVFSAVQSISHFSLSRPPLVLFNVKPDQSGEERCVRQGVQGLVYMEDPVQRFLEGVRAVAGGDVWISRKLLLRCVLKGAKDFADLKELNSDPPVLTPGQKRILALLAIGAGNEEIADRLCLSIHTVKTHLYHIYRKIGAKNRWQAIRWATKNL
jgi:LuxR family transcriptional regulator of csgAB operon